MGLWVVVLGLSAVGVVGAAVVQSLRLVAADLNPNGGVTPPPPPPPWPYSWGFGWWYWDYPPWAWWERPWYNPYGWWPPIWYFDWPEFSPVLATSGTFANVADRKSVVEGKRG